MHHFVHFLKQQNVSEMVPSPGELIILSTQQSEFLFSTKDQPHKTETKDSVLI